MRKRYSRSYTVLSFLTMFSYREQPFGVSFLLVWDGVAFNGPPVTAAAAWLPLWGSCHDEAVTERENLL